MAGGFQLPNDHGGFLIDSRWKNYSLVSKTSLVSSNNSWGENNYAGCVYTNNTSDVVFVESAAEMRLVCARTYNGQRNYYVGTPQAGQTVTFYAFRRQPANNSNAGFQVFNHITGELIFDSTDKVCRVSGEIALTPSSQSYSVSYGAGRKYAITTHTLTGQLVESDSGSGSGQMGFRNLVTNAPRIRTWNFGIEFLGFGIASQKQIPIQNPIPGVRVTNVQGAPYLVCDVTGY